MFFLTVGELEHGFSHIDLPLGSTPSAQGSACLGSGQSLSPLPLCQDALPNTLPPTILLSSACLRFVGWSM